MISLDFKFIFPFVVLALLAYLTFVILFCRNRKVNLPPLTKHGLFEIVSSHESGRIIDLVRRSSQELGSVFRVRMPQLRPFIMVTDGALARLILDGDKTRGIPGADKDSIYHRLNAATFDVSNFFTKKTVGEGWERARKAISPSFSNLNIRKKIPLLQTSLSQLCDKLTKYENVAHQFDLQRLITRFIFDFSTIALFGMCFNALDESETDGNKLLCAIDITMREYLHRQLHNPLRKYFLWDKEVRKAFKARKFIETFLNRMVNDYRASMSAEDLKTESSLLAQLVRRQVYLSSIECM